MQFAMSKLQKIIIGFAVLMVLFGAVTKMVDTIRKQRAEIGRFPVTIGVERCTNRVQNQARGCSSEA